MNNDTVLLTKCFLATFPEMRPEEVNTASAATTDKWDSVASVTLFSLIEEEFGVALSLDALDEFSSFQQILAHLKQRTPS